MGRGFSKSFDEVGSLSKREALKKESCLASRGSCASLSSSHCTLFLQRSDMLLAFSPCLTQFVSTMARVIRPSIPGDLVSTYKTRKG